MACDARPARGRVVLVGAGPGDPGLLTLHGQRWLAAADVVVHDHLVHPRLLEHVRPQAEVIAVGQPHVAGMRLEQGAIERLLIERATRGQLVVRLKIGDPFVFGRGAEEASALRAAGIPFEIVPGVSAAIAVPAYAGIPVTHRAHASLVTIATAHQAHDADSGHAGPPALPWELLARQGGTLVFLMAVKHLEAVLAALLRHGLDPQTPAAIVERGTLGTQRTVAGTAATLAAQARAAGIRPPATLVVGSVASLREQIAWVERRPLLGRRIVVTRAHEQAGELARRLEDEGAEVVVFPTIAIVPPPDAAALDAAVRRAAGYDWIVFTSVNGVRVFFDRLAALGGDVRELAPVRIAAIGPGTVSALESRLLRPAVVAAEFRAEGVLAALATEDLRGRRVLLPRAAGARSVLPAELSARGAQVEEVVAYRAVPPPAADPGPLRKALEAGDIDAVTFTSSSTVRHFVELLGRDVVARVFRPGRPVVACIGPVTAATVAELGLASDIVASEYTVPALAAAMVAYFAPC